MNWTSNESEFRTNFEPNTMLQRLSYSIVNVGLISYVVGLLYILNIVNCFTFTPKLLLQRVG